MKRVLIVDDSRVSRRMLRNMLEMEGFEVVGDAINGKEGYDQYVKLSPDVVAMDITMPEMSGIEALKLIKEHDPDARVIIISAAGQKDKIEEASLAGAAAFITKPYDNKDIIDAINRC